MRRSAPIMLSALLLPALASAATIYVDDNAPPGGNGVSWGTAFRFLQDALTAAGGGDEIRVAQGTYYPDRDAMHQAGTGNRGASFTLKDNVALVGGYAGLTCPRS